MSRYKVRDVIAMVVLISVAAFTCGPTPIVQDLIHRVEALEAESVELANRVATIEAESASLTNRIALLEEQGETVAASLERLDLIQARLDFEPVLVDANGKEVGTRVTSLESTRPSVMFELEGLPLFVLSVHPNDLRSSNGGDLFFQTTNCTGPAFFSQNPDEIMPYVWIQRNLTGFPVYVANPDPGAYSQVTVNSRLAQFETACRLDTRTISLAPAIPAFVWQDEFTPPFRVVTRRELNQ